MLVFVREAERRTEANMPNQYSPEHREMLEQTVGEVAATMYGADITLADYLKLLQLSDEAENESKALIRAGWKRQCK